MLFPVLSLLTTSALAVSYDYVVCGGGTAGTALAARLAQGSNSSVLLIEAGPNPDVNPTLSVPANALPNQDDDTDWHFTAAAANGLPAFEYTRGKVLGGSSQYNYMAYTRGPAAYYDYVADYLEDESWSWNETFPYFEKSLNVTSSLTASAAAPIYGARGGPLQLNYDLPMAEAVSIERQAFEEHLNLYNIDYNDGDVIGYQTQALTVSSEGLRSSSWASFGALGQTFSNFHVLTNSMVVRVNFANSTGSCAKQVTSVSYLDLATNETQKVWVNKEAIISGGFIQTPQMLQLSGIGPKDILEELDVPLEIELPAVGQGLQDHLLIGGMALMLDNVTTANEAFQTAVGANLSALTSLHAYGDRSAYSTLWGGPIAFQHVNSSVDTAPSTAWPNQEWIGNSPLNVSNLTPSNELAPSIVVIAPISRGNISLLSNNVLDKPVLFPNYLGTSEDKQFAIDSYRRLQELIHSPPWSYSLASNSPAYNSSMTDTEVLTAIAAAAGLLYHGCCTAAAGPNSTVGVVNSKLVVHGTTNLRVVDLSVIPRIVPAHTQAIVYMIAEKAADDILKGVVT